MNIAEPIKSRAQLEKFKEYYRIHAPSPRNYLFISIGLNTALRVSDILCLKWRDVYRFDECRMREHLLLREHKTGKTSSIFLNEAIESALLAYMEYLRDSQDAIYPEKYLFYGQKNPDGPITRTHAFRIIKEAAQFCHMEGTISCHSLRKTFGYHAWKQGAEPAILMNIFNHSSYRITKRYLGIDQDDRDEIFQKNVL